MNLLPRASEQTTAGADVFSCYFNKKATHVAAVKALKGWLITKIIICITECSTLLRRKCDGRLHM